MGALIATIFTVIAIAISSFAIVNPNISLDSRSKASTCVAEGGIYANGTGDCCADLVKTNCGGSGSFAFCYCRKPTAPTPTPTTRSCVKRTCSGSICKSENITVPYSQACPSSNCTNDDGCQTSTPTSTPTTLPTSNCADTNQSCSSLSCCNTNDVCTSLFGGKYCVIKGDCTPGAKKCQLDGSTSYQYICNSTTGYFDRGSRCDFGCDGNSCKVGVCTPGEIRCNPTNDYMFQTCTVDASGWEGEYCSVGCQTFAGFSSCAAASTNYTTTPHTCDNQGGTCVLNTYECSAGFSTDLPCSSGKSCGFGTCSLPSTPTISPTPRLTCNNQGGTCVLSRSICSDGFDNTLLCPANKSCGFGTCSLPSPTPTCRKEGELFSSTISCCSPLIKVNTPYGAFCGKKGDCTPGTKKCQKDGTTSFEYVCDSSGYFQRDKRCDFGCDGRSCKAGCIAGQTRCDPERPNELETCSSSAWIGKTCTLGCETINSTKAQCKAINCEDPIGTPGTQVCNNAGGYNYCSESGNWYSRGCETGTVCAGGQCVAPKDCVNPPTSHGSAVCTSTGKSYNYCENGNWYNKQCDFDTVCPSGWTKCVSRSEASQWHYSCSASGDFVLFVNNQDLGIDWDKSQRCSEGCENGVCMGGVIYSCQENQVSLDGYEKCVDGYWQCIPGQTRRLSLPGQSNLAGNLSGCDQNNNTFGMVDSSSYLKSLSCDNNNNLINKEKEIVRTCSSEEKCLEKNSYNFVNYAGCYHQEYILANSCQDGEVKEPSSPNDCKMVCEKDVWIFTDPLYCLRDPVFLSQPVCDEKVRGNILVDGNIVDTCPFGCIYGRCIPEEESSCEQSQGYLSGYPPCLVDCVDGHYQNTQICSNDIRMGEENWNDREALFLLKSINNFPEKFKDTIENLTFDRIYQPFADCFDGCQSLASGYYNPDDKTVGIPDTGVDEMVINHEIIHAISDSSSQILDGFIEATGCKQDITNINGNYLYNEAPYREYGAYNCEEGLAVSCGEEYLNPYMSCSMQSARPNAYNFCKEEVFDNNEFCERGGVGSETDKMIKRMASILPVVYAADSLSSPLSNSVEATLESLLPGTTTAEVLESILVTPIITEQPDKTIYSFTSTDKSRSHVVYVKDNIITFIQIVVDKNYSVNVTDVTTQFGEPEDISFSTHGHNSQVYSYPQKGISFIFDGGTNQVTMIQKYVPTTKEEFKETVGSNFETQPYGDSFQEAIAIKENLASETGAKHETSTKINPNTTIPIILAVLLIGVAIIVILRKIIRHKQENTGLPPVPKI